MRQLQEALTSAVVAVLVNAAGQSLVRAFPPVAEEGVAPAAAAGQQRTQVPHPWPDSALEGGVQLAVAAVLFNTQRHASALGAACSASVAAGGPRPQTGPGASLSAAAAEARAAGLQGQEALPGHEGTEVPPDGAGVVKRAGARWSREQIQVMADHLQTLPNSGRGGRGGGGLATREAMRKLGLAGLPDPEGRLFLSVNSRLVDTRNLLARGLDPLQANAVLRAKKYTYNWRAWLRQAFRALPNREGTLDDAGTVLEADPDIALLLDRRPDSRKRHAPRWRLTMAQRRISYSEFEDTGVKRGRQIVFRYNEQVAHECDAAVRAKAPKRGVSGLPYLGKES